MTCLDDEQGNGVRRSICDRIDTFKDSSLRGRTGTRGGAGDVAARHRFRILRRPPMCLSTVVTMLMVGESLEMMGVYEVGKSGLTDQSRQEKLARLNLGQPWSSQTATL